jgi:outer membrane protein assembly factor BamB
MCATGEVPQAAAFALDDGTLRWVSCTTGEAFRMVQAVTDDAVYVFSGPEQVVALDPDDGTVLADAPPAPTPDSMSQSGGHAPIEVDGFQVTGGQDDPVRVSGSDGSNWSQPGVWVYDDVWAIDDGAVFAVEREGSRLVAYQLEDGEVRWSYTGDPYGEGLWPWLAEDGRLFTMWSNLQVRDTATGDLLWRTEYPPPTNPAQRLAGIATDDDTVYVGFGTAASGGD